MIYCLQSKLGEPIKIGYTKDKKTLTKRIKSIQTGYPYILNILCTFNGDIYLETEIHQRLKSQKLIGEWFKHSNITEGVICFYYEGKRPPLKFREETRPYFSDVGIREL